MTAVFVHGVPDTHRVWRPVMERLDRAGAVALSLPGFDAPLPEGFTATKDEYVSWLIRELERFDGPVDLVGQDWGSLLVTRVASLRPDLVASFVGGGAPVSGEYVWHKAARLFQQPGAGEKTMAGLNEITGVRLLMANGVPEDQAREAARQIDGRMKDCILRLYRSALTVFPEWEPELSSIRALGLVLWGGRDQYASARFADRMGEQTGARVVHFPDCGHWWQCEAPERTADEIAGFWRELGR
ncbi:MAG: alpha/beta fold hydrolase [Alphaproteobacteria bacterium]|nr:alpha/beta fold hydrolase [Alphaproteobacteria bacterium]